MRTRKIRTHHLLFVLVIGTSFGCPTEEGPTESECPGPLKEAAQTCNDPECTATEGLKLFGQATLDSLEAKSWVVPVWATSEVAAASEMTTIRYRVESAGALTGSNGFVARGNSIERARGFLGEAQFSALFSSERAARIRAEAAIRAQQTSTDIDLESLSGSGIQPRLILPDNIHKQSASCSASAPACGDTALCLLPAGSSDGTCETALTIKFRNGAQVDDVAATVKKVGMFGAIVVDDALNVPQDQIDQLLMRFDTHIAPLDHQFFGLPKNSAGKDRDGNGVVIIFLTPKVAEIDANLAGFFASDDLADPATGSSNGADLLYMREPSANITLDQLSGTIGHEYQHLINFYAKNNAGSDAEEVWLDEGLATFAEDMLGYGSDSFENIAAYLAAIDQTSLTGEGGCPDGSTTDSICRRGMAHLLVRYFFEQKGGATFGDGPGMATDGGGIAAVKKLVQSAATGTSLFDVSNSGRSFNDWMGGLITTVANDGAGYAGVSCNPQYKLDPPETAAFTNYQRGIDLRTSFRTFKGTTVNLTGPMTTDLAMEDVPLFANAGEIRKLDIASGQMKIGVGGAFDYEVGFHALPANK